MISTNTSQVILVLTKIFHMYLTYVIIRTFFKICLTGTCLEISQDVWKCDKKLNKRK